MTLPYEVYVDAIEQEAERIGDLGERGTKIAVRTHPGWDLEALITHVATSFLHACAQLASPDEEIPPQFEERPTPQALEALEEGRLALLALLRDRDVNDPCWNAIEDEPTVGFLARRLAHETALHRVDAEVARGGANTIAAELAADGIDERLNLLLPYQLAEREPLALGGSICLICSDQAAAWTVDVPRGRYRVRAGRAPADAAVVATASDLFCFCWNRPTIRPLQVTGRMAVVEAWQGLPDEVGGY